MVKRGIGKEREAEAEAAAAAIKNKRPRCSAGVAAHSAPQLPPPPLLLVSMQQLGVGSFRRWLVAKTADDDDDDFPFSISSSAEEKAEATIKFSPAIA